MKPEWHISCTEDGCYKAGVKEAKESGMYIKGSISIEDIGHLLQGRHITLLFLNDDYEQEARLDIELTDEKTNFSVSNKLNDLIITEDKSVSMVIGLY